jgi:hypothetical protein
MEQALTNHNRLPSRLLCVLLAMGFIGWLTWVIADYYTKKPQTKPDIAKQALDKSVPIEQLSLPPLPILASKLISPQQDKKAYQREAERESTTPQVANKQPSKNETAANQQQAEHSYQQLTQLGVDVQLAWPQLARERQTLFDFMYQCVGIQFAVLNEHKITQINQSPVSNFSDWIRVAQGSLSNKEQNWLNAFALAGTPIRLFPRDIDMQLAKHIAKALKGAPLKTLKANYQYGNGTLFLTNIVLNKQSLSGNWPLYKDEC